MHHVVELFLIAGILIHAAMKESAYEAAVHPVAMTNFMISIPIYVAMEN